MFTKSSALISVTFVVIFSCSELSLELSEIGTLGFSLFKTIYGAIKGELSSFSGAGNIANRDWVTSSPPTAGLLGLFG